jgi:hypothetical protein
MKIRQYINLESLVLQHKKQIHRDVPYQAICQLKTKPTPEKLQRCCEVNERSLPFTTQHLLESLARMDENIRGNPASF